MKEAERKLETETEKENSKQIVCDKWLIMLPGSKGIGDWDLLWALPLALWWHDEHVACPKAPSPVFPLHHVVDAGECCPNKDGLSMTVALF